MFDKHLVSLAVEKGARLEKSTSLLSINGSVAKTTIGDIEAKVVVGADGPNSLVARESGLQRPTLRYPAITGRADGEFGQVVKMFFGKVAPGGYAWVIPKDEGANIGLGFSDKVFSKRPSDALDEFARSLGCRVSGASLGFVPMSGPVPSTTRGNVLLVGDAAGHTMPSNGGGIPTAMIAGRFAGKAIKAHLGDGTPLAKYEDAWRKVMEAPLRNSLRTRRLAGIAFSSDVVLGAAMAALGRRGLDRAIRCQRLLV